MRRLAAGAARLLAPVPLGNVAPALANGLIAFATLEEDGMLLGAALAAWEAVGATGWVPGIL